MKYLGSYAYSNWVKTATRRDMILHEGCQHHDPNFCVYDDIKDEFIICESTKQVQNKLFSFVPKRTPDIEVLWNDFLQAFNLENDFKFFVNGNLRPKVLQTRMGYSYELEKMVKTDEHLLGCTHHVSHALSAYAQSPYKRAAILSYDGGSHDGNFLFGSIDESFVFKRKKINFPLGYFYAATGFMHDSLIKEEKRTDLFGYNNDHNDYSGKIMGLAAYGKENDALFNELTQIMTENSFDDINFPLQPYNRFDREYFFLDNQEVETKCTSWLWAQYHRNRYPVLKNIVANFNGESDLKDLCYNLQKAFEYGVLRYLNEPENRRIISEHDNNLIVTGGCALNVLTNERIKNELGINVFVPPGQGDEGHGLGILYDFLVRRKIVDPRKRYDVTFSGAPIQNSKQELQTIFEKRRPTKHTLQELVDFVEEGNIIGVIMGNSEYGPRALGHRSIICDANIEGMRDKINFKIKNREWYRPFAPMCRDIDAPIYFESRNFDNMEYMSFAPMVKPKYRDQIPSVVHIDGSARLQTIPPSYKFYWDFLSRMKKNRVLLNTSFNVRGKPILNNLNIGLKIMEDTDLSAVLYIEDDNYYLFKK